MTSTLQKKSHLVEPSSPIEINETGIGVGMGIQTENLVKTVLDGRAKHIVQKDGVAFESEIAAAKLMIDDPNTFLHFPLSSILTPDQAGSEQEVALTKLSVKCSSGAERHACTDRVTQQLEGLVNAGLLSEIQIATLELVSNAVFHGPQKEFKHIEYDNQGHEFQNSKPVYIKPSFVTLGHDSERIVISCRDLYGELNVKNVLERVHRCFEFGVPLTINHGKGGAGIGCFLMFNLALAVYIGVTPGSQTMTAITFPMRGSRVKRLSVPRNIHVYSGPEKK